MYWKIELEDRVRVPPQYFSMNLNDAITQILREKYERICDKDLGVIISIWDAKTHGDGTVIHGDGAAYYDVSFLALTYLPEVNEIYEAEVSELVEFGAFLDLGPVEGLVHLSQIANDFLTFNKKIPAFVGKESKKSLKKGDHVFAKVSTVSMKSSLNDVKIGLTMRPEGLGKDEWIVLAEKKKTEESKKTQEKK
ncbi:MAG: DNA-directed RNA polymerase [Candidatus Anstonellales archaeon]